MITTAEMLKSATELAAQLTAHGRLCTPDDVLLAAQLTNIAESVIKDHPEVDSNLTRELRDHLPLLVVLGQVARAQHDKQYATVDERARDLLGAVMGILVALDSPK